MRSILKSVVMMLVCTIVLSLFKVTYVQAQEIGGISPRYTSISKCQATLSLSGEDEVLVSASVIGIVGTSSTSMVAVLQRQRGSNWVNVKTWENSSASRMVTLQENYPVSSGSYRVKLTGTADGESVTVYSGTLTY